MYDSNNNTCRPKNNVEGPVGNREGVYQGEEGMIQHSTAVHGAVQYSSGRWGALQAYVQLSPRRALILRNATGTRKIGTTPGTRFSKILPFINSPGRKKFINGIAQASFF